MSLTKQDLQNIKALMKEEVTSSEHRILGKMDARFDTLEEEVKQVQAATLENFDAIEKNTNAIERNGVAIRRNGDDIRKNSDSIRRNGDAIRKNSDSINYLANKVDLSNQNISSRFDIHEEKILQVEMQVKR